MKRQTKLLVGAIAFAAAMALPGLAASADDMMQSDEAAIQEIWNTYSTARVAGDADTWLALWDEGGIQMPPGMPARGKAVLDEEVPKAFAPGQVSAMNIHPEEITVAGDWAYTRGVYDSDRVVDGKAVHIDGKFMTILKRQPDGAWKIYRDIFNFNTQ